MGGVSCKDYEVIFFIINLKFSLYQKIVQLTILFYSS